MSLREVLKRVLRQEVCPECLSDRIEELDLGLEVGRFTKCFNCGWEWQ